MRRKVWSTGHVVIPKAMRDSHNIHPGDRVSFAERDGSIVIRKASPNGSTAEPQRPLEERAP